MKQRILVAVVGVPLLLLVLVWAPDWATMALVMLLSVIGAHELMHALCGAEKARRWWGLASTMSVFAVISVAWSDEKYRVWGLALTGKLLLSAFIVLAFVCMVVEYGKDNALSFTDMSAVFAAGLAVPLALSCLLRLRMMPYGGGMVLIPLVAAFCSDSAALFTGMACGKHKLAPLVSPKKTVEGAIGGLVGGMVGMVIFRIVFFFCTVHSLNILWCMLLGLVGAAMGQLGDLSFSAIKRQCGIKDYGRLLPGHGGVLDRFDSVIFAAPVIWLIVSHVTL